MEIYGGLLHTIIAACFTSHITPFIISFGQPVKHSSDSPDGIQLAIAQVFDNGDEKQQQ